MISTDLATTTLSVRQKFSGKKGIYSENITGNLAMSKGAAWSEADVCMAIAAAFS